MINNILKFGLIAAIIWGTFTLFKQWPVESFIVLGIVIIFIIIKWLIDLD